MPRKPRHSAEQLVDAALALTRREGMEAVSARGVAAELGCSTAPVFTHFASMDALHEAVLDRAIAAFVDFAERMDGPDPLTAFGLGMVRFAATERRLYHALFLSPHRWHFKWGPVRRRLAARMADHPRYASLDDAARFGLVGRTSVIAHGLGVEVWSGRLGHTDHLLPLLRQLADPVIDAAIAHGWTSEIHGGSPASPDEGVDPVDRAS